ncbi:MAG: amidohydrolase [Mogibacterium sp.]|nr:amidohydrolase [Mogibacterium sp.]
MRVQDVAAKYSEEVIALRRKIHENPEVSGKEVETSKLVQEELTKAGIEWRHCGTEGYGILATIKGAKPGKTVMLRADMDALTVVEETGLPFASKNEGIMHACGHDCHTATLIVAAKILNEMKDELCGTVKLAFQSAEEIALGAKWMCADGVMDGVDGCFGIHVWGGVPVGTFNCQPGARMAAVRQFEVEVTGKGGHGAQPHNCIDAVVAGAAIVQNLQSIVSRTYDPMEPVVVTIGEFLAGTRWNVVAGSAKLTGTIRCYSKEINANIEEVFNRIAIGTGEAMGCEVSVKHWDLLPPTVNDAAMADLAKASAIKIMGEEAFLETKPTTGGEDFSIYTDYAPGAFMFMGISNPACNAVYANHHGKFDVDESALINSSMIYAQVALDHNAQ